MLEVNIKQKVQVVKEEDLSISEESIDLPEIVDVDLDGETSYEIELPSQYSIEIEGLQNFMTYTKSTSLILIDQN